MQNSVSISFSKKSQLITLYYQGPNNCGEQSFRFDPHVFISCFNKAKFKRFTPKDEYLSFDELFFDSHYPKANSLVRNIFASYSINPTSVKKAIHQNKKLHRRLVVTPKPSANAPKKPRTARFTPSVDKIIDQVEIERCRRNMDLAVSKAASSFDLSFFDSYLDSYVELRKASSLSPYLSKRAKLRLLDSFSKLVSDTQSKLF